MKKFWKILSNWKLVVKLIDLIKDAYADKEVTESEAEEVLSEAVSMLIEMGVIKMRAADTSDEEE